jgi:phosphatidylglycerophosphate synthase
MFSRVANIPRSLLVLTLGRLLLMPLIIGSFDHLPAVTTAALALFIAADLYDGVAARRLRADGTARRTLDTLVDRVSIWSGYIVVTAEGYLSVWLLVVFGVRELYAGYWCQRLLRERDVVIRADWMYRGLNLSLAGWVVAAPFLDQAGRNALFCVVLGVAAIVAMDVSRSLRLVLSMPRSVRSAVIPAGELRRDRALQRQGIPSPTAYAPREPLAG